VTGNMENGDGVLAAILKKHISISALSAELIGHVLPNRQCVANMSLHITTVRHVTGNDKDYLRKIPRVVW
jgi:hypothetical protein